VKIAACNSGRTRGPAAARMALISSAVGISMPILSFCSLRLSLSIRFTANATFCATVPRRCASLSSDLRLDMTLRPIARDMAVSKSSRNILSCGVVRLASFMLPIRSLICFAC
jgi:hypothetical protein